MIKSAWRNPFLIQPFRAEIFKSISTHVDLHHHRSRTEKSRLKEFGEIFHNKSIVIDVKLRDTARFHSRKLKLVENRVFIDISNFDGL